MRIVTLLSYNLPIDRLSPNLRIKMIKIKPLAPKKLCSYCDPKQLKFTTTAELAPLKEPIGQERAMAAIEFGISMPEKGYNLYLLGPEGTGKHALIESFLTKQIRHQNTPSDWCYIYNFIDPLHPIAVRLPPGSGIIFRNDMQILIESLKMAVSAVIQDAEFKKTISVSDYRNDFILAVIRQFTKPLLKKYIAYSLIQNYLSAIENDIVNNWDNFNHFVNYKVNVLVHHEKKDGAPVIQEDFPNTANLFGKIEYLNEEKNYFTHFTLIKPGALHKANGGYLILDAAKLLSQPQAWEQLKKALFTQTIQLELLGQTIGFPNLMTLEPEPIPLDVKVILVGDRNLYYLLSEHDANFSDLFKVAADFSNHIPRNKHNFSIYSRLIATLTMNENLHPLDRGAVARLIDHSSRLANDTKRMATHMRELINLLKESHYWARKRGANIIKNADVQKAIDQQIYRANRIETRIHEDLRRNILLIDTKGKKIGQINGLSVMQVGQYSFSIPARITATVHLGKGEVVDIEREVELGGAIHSKGVLILSGFLASRYLPDKHLSIAASLVFEQNYGEVEGDSASVAELTALLSAIAHLPVDQSFGITGSINQYGQVQAIGSLNEKIEGFYYACKLKGLTGKQGVIIPTANVQHLMLKEEVVQAAIRKEFFIYAVENIDQVMEILTQKTAGLPNKKGKFPKNTINGLIEASLLKFLEHAEAEHKNTPEPGEAV
jgi:lon-related putative ATP-dependent protease